MAQKTHDMVRESLPSILAGGDFADGTFRRLLDILPAAVYTTDADGVITYYNHAATAMWGVSPELGKSEYCGSWKLYWPDGRTLPHDECPMALTLQDGKPHHGMEAVAERPDGIQVPFIAYPTPLFDAAGNLAGAVNMLIDISDRKRHELTQERLAAIVDGSDDAIISKDLNGVITSWNTGAQRVFGYTAEEAIGKPIIMLIPAEHIDEEPTILDRIRRGERVDHYETVRQRKDGEKINISLTVSPLRSVDGRVVGASKIARDITERKRQQQQQALLVREMKHRIKNTIATVQSMATQTLTDVGPEQHHAFSARLTALAGVHDLLTMDNWQRTTLGAVLTQTLRPFRDTYGERISFTGADISLRPDIAQTLTLVLHELATNAVKYGALSSETGKASINWHPSASDPLSGTLIWSEAGGPSVIEPKRTGFGSKLIKRALGPSANLDFRKEGIQFSVQLSHQ